jgi:predicted Zn-dependent peptidase
MLFYLVGANPRGMRVEPSTGAEAPLIVKEVLQNGLTLVTEGMEHVRSVAVGVWLRRGSRHESGAKAGISHFIEHMVFKGTRHRTAEDIASEVDSMGGYMDAFTAKEYASFHLKVLDAQLEKAVDILADVVMNPLFAASEMIKEKRVIREEIHMVEDTPDDLVMELFNEAFWPKHPLGRRILGSKRSVAALTRDDLASYFHEVYRPGNLVIAAAGHLDHAAARELIVRHFGGLEAGGTSTNGGPPNPAARIVARSKKELEQVHVCLGGPAFPQAHADRYGAFVLNTVLGGSMSSRLFQNIREQKGLAYSISSGLASYSDAGSLTIYAGTSVDVVDQVIALTMDEIRRVLNETVPAAELRRAKDHLKGSLMLALESTGSRMSNLARQEIYFGRQYGLEEVLDGIEAVQADDLLRIAGTVFSDGLTLSILGPLGAYRPRPSQIRV